MSPRARIALAELAIAGDEAALRTLRRERPIATLGDLLVVKREAARELSPAERAADEGRAYFEAAAGGRRSGRA